VDFLFVGMCLCAFQLFLLLPKSRREPVHFTHPTEARMTLVLTAYNDEKSIAQAVRDFKTHPMC
jgi:hypothetical protein